MYTLKIKSCYSELEFEFADYSDLTEFMWTSIFFQNDSYEYVVTYRPEEGDK